MTQKRQRNILSLHSASIVRDPDIADTALPDLCGDLSGPRVHRIFPQLLYHRSRPLHNLTRSDLVDRLLVQYRDLSHLFSHHLFFNLFCSR